ncbi:hypothetical protein E6W36_11660 [Hankyongella ginsenosidimutans]|uniref:Calcium-binding protein n=1 Tax=Hankyongella ginsenosidimutans TaxID=1763828 RepID=A0A4D7BZ10_9SPHN|nr:hypothetical protein E6W36_11660 [Hankyongella ginsenosidimutans]
MFVRIDLSKNSVKASSIENITGSDYHDYITGNNSANRISGGLGDDTIGGGGGNDWLEGGAGHNTIEGGDGQDQILVEMMVMNYTAARVMIVFLVGTIMMCLMVAPGRTISMAAADPTRSITDPRMLA